MWYKNVNSSQLALTSCSRIPLWPCSPQCHFQKHNFLSFIVIVLYLIIITTMCIHFTLAFGFTRYNTVYSCVGTFQGSSRCSSWVLAALVLRLEELWRSCSGWHTVKGRGTHTTPETPAGSSVCLTPAKHIILHQSGNKGKNKLS